MQDELLVLRDLDQLRDVVERPGEVDVGVTAGAKDAEVPVQADVDARGLHARGVEGVDADAPRCDRGADVTIREHHRREVWG